MTVDGEAGVGFRYIIERVMFASRWLMLPLYLGLILSLVMLAFKFLQKLVSLVPGYVGLDFNTAMVDSLKLVDITLTGNLLLMVILAGYENFIAPMRHLGGLEQPQWMGHVDFTDLKMKLITAIIAISAIQLLERFMNIGDQPANDLLWSVILHVTFLVSGLLLALMNRISHPPEQ
ncbi:MAG TPA: TIGR00645 family protein [Rhodopila sp.]|nr:TIGR00645 family protein [Rhodopila sp.]HVZ06339.1 TIGR00645 family protein [Rhodopila sp.]